MLLNVFFRTNYMVGWRVHNGGGIFWIWTKVEDIAQHVDIFNELWRDKELEVNLVRAETVIDIFRYQKFYI